MNHIYLRISLIIMVFTTIGCSHKVDKEYTRHQQQADSLTLIETIREDSLKKVYIKNLVNTIDSGETQIADEFIFSTNLLPQAYKTKSYTPLWGTKKNRDDAMLALSEAKLHGLLPLDYHIETIDTLVRNYNTLSLGDVATCDLLLTDAILLYAYHLHKGKVNPSLLSETWNYSDKGLPKHALNLFLQALETKDIRGILNGLEPQDKEYQALKQQLALLTHIKKIGGWKMVHIKTPLHPNSQDCNMPTLRKRLILEGYLMVSDTSSSCVYDSLLVAAIKQFQINHGLHGDGIIGDETLQTLQISAHRKMQIVQVNLERRRWIHPYPKDVSYLTVNIARFMLQFIENGKISYSCNVVVGKKHKETPIFFDTLETIILNPTWLLPYSISSTETLSKIQKDPTYLTQKNMVILNHQGKRVNPNEINWARYTAKDFPYLVRQEPGEHNALGRVKFLFPNKESIYLHDTPAKQLFSKEERAFSHGCIRVDKALDLALFLLKKEDITWDKQKLDTIIATNKVYQVSLKHRYPIQILYQTAGMTSEGAIYFYKDIYERDKRIYEKLMKRETTQEILASRIK